jgi:hypothetical protein
MEGVNSSMMYLLYCKNFFEYHNVPPLSTTIFLKRSTEYIIMKAGMVAPRNLCGITQRSYICFSK